MDVILSATDALRQLIDNLESSGTEGEVQTEPIIAKLEAILAGEAIAPDVEDEPAAAEPEPDPEPEPEPGPRTRRGRSPGDEGEDLDPGKKVGGKFTVTPEVNGDPYQLTVVGEGHLADFLEEAHEIIENLNSGLLELNSSPTRGGDLVNDIFRYFHNLKGNSGIIGFKELNSWTHEAETLLNKVRKDEIPCTNSLIDLLLSVVDFIESLINYVDPATGKVTPLDITVLVEPLQKAVEDGGIMDEEDAAPAPEPEPEPGSRPSTGARASCRSGPDAHTATGRSVRRGFRSRRRRHFRGRPSINSSTTSHWPCKPCAKDPGSGRFHRRPLPESGHHPELHRIHGVRRHQGLCRTHGEPRGPGPQVRHGI